MGGTYLLHRRDTSPGNGQFLGGGTDLRGTNLSGGGRPPGWRRHPGGRLRAEPDSNPRREWFSRRPGLVRSRPIPRDNRPPRATAFIGPPGHRTAWRGF